MTDDLLHIDMTVRERNIKFDLTYDPGFLADICTKRFLERNGACEPDTVHVMRRVIRPGDFVIDGGANIGFFTMLLSRLVGKQGHVEAFEPATVNFKKLCKNLELNKVENVTAINRALWSEEADLMIHIAPDTGLSSLMPFEAAITSLPVKTLTLDRWCSNYDQRPRLIKLDIEGAEEHALIGAAQMLETGVDFVVTEINERALFNFGSSQHDLRHYMKSKDYDMFWMHEDGSAPTLVTADQVLEGAENMNALFSKSKLVRDAWETPLS
jgi:FkbM family methyltransferase